MLKSLQGEKINVTKSRIKNKFLTVFCITAIIVILLLMVSVYIIGGMTGAYAWSFALFIIAPLGVLLSMIYLVILIFRIIRKKNCKWVLCNFIISMCLAFPILILFGIANIAYPAKENTAPAITFEIPVTGDVVLLGGKEYKTHAVWPSECYAYDIVAEPYDTGDNSCESYGVYGREILAPLAGTIIEAHDGEEDIAPNSEEFTSSMGNYIFMEIEATKTYLIFAHLKQGSVNVREGDYVNAGDLIAQVGNSGTTSEPHLHIQHQRNNPKNMIWSICSEGLPIIFK